MVFLLPVDSDDVQEVRSVVSLLPVDSDDVQEVRSGVSVTCS